METKLYILTTSPRKTSPAVQTGSRKTAAFRDLQPTPSAESRQSWRGGSGVQGEGLKKDKLKTKQKRETPTLRPRLRQKPARTSKRTASAAAAARLCKVHRYFGSPPNLLALLFIKTPPHTHKIRQ